MKTQVTIVIPARNEEGVIINTLYNIEKQVKVPYFILVVDDGSADDTYKKVKKHFKDKEGLIIKNTGEKGFASALKLGFSKAKTEYVIPVMADLCDNPRTVIYMLQLAEKNNLDIVCGSRYMRGGDKRGGPWLQGFMSMLVCKSLKIITGIPTWDVSNAFKLYRKKTLNKVRFNLESGVEISMEITLQAFFKGAKIAEIPTNWKGRTFGKSKFKIFQRTPKYARIYFWALENSIRRKFNLELKKFYV